MIKSFWVKLYSGHGCWRHPRQVAKNCEIGSFEGFTIWLKQALDREYRLQKYFLSSYLLSTFDWLGFGQGIWWNINWNKAYLATFGNFFRMLLSYSTWWVSPQFARSIFLTKSWDSSGKVKSNWLASPNICFSTIDDDALTRIKNSRTGQTQSCVEYRNNSSTQSIQEVR